MVKNVHEPVVFIVDDDEDARESMQRLMVSVGLRSRTYGSAVDFLDEVGPSAAGCAVVDVRLPGMSGLDLQARLRQEDYTLPVVVVTAYADVPMAVRAIKQGAIDFLEKPYRGQTLLDAVQFALAEDTRIRSARTEQRGVLARLERLTPREREVVDLVVEGLTSKQIAARFGLSPKTIHVHRAEAMAKIEARSVVELARMMMEAKTYELESSR